MPHGVGAPLGIAGVTFVPLGEGGGGAGVVAKALDRDRKEGVSELRRQTLHPGQHSH